MLVLSNIYIVQKTSPTSTSPKHSLSFQFIKLLWHTVFCWARLGSSLHLHPISMRVSLGLSFFLAFLNSGEFSIGTCGVPMALKRSVNGVLHLWSYCCHLSHKPPPSSWGICAAEGWGWPVFGDLWSYEPMCRWGFWHPQCKLTVWFSVVLTGDIARTAVRVIQATLRQPDLW